MSPGRSQFSTPTKSRANRIERVRNCIYCQLDALVWLALYMEYRQLAIWVNVGRCSGSAAQHCSIRFLQSLLHETGTGGLNVLCRRPPAFTVYMLSKACKILYKEDRELVSSFMCRNTIQESNSWLLIWHDWCLEVQTNSSFENWYQRKNKNWITNYSESFCLYLSWTLSTILEPKRMLRLA